MGSVEYTKEQQRVIDERDANILVSAAAGSGKTAVLTERILSLLLDKDKGTDIDRMLIVTFTKAAAAEMRERIGNRIAAYLTEHPKDRKMERQMTLLHNAQITTIDSFCLFVIRNNFTDIGLDPSFRIADEGEKKLLMQEVLNEVLTEAFEERSEDFLYFVESYSDNGWEDKMEEMILDLFTYSESHPDPHAWLTAQCEADWSDETASFDLISKSDWYRHMDQRVKESLILIKRLSEKGLEICDRPEGPVSYRDAIAAYSDFATRLLSQKGHDERRKSIRNAAFPAFKAGKKSQPVNEAYKLSVKKIRDRVSALKDDIKEYYAQSEEEIVANHHRALRLVRELVRLTLCFSERFSQSKRDKNLLDFSDMEHMALQILIKEEDGKTVPTKAAMEYRKYFDYVFVDEYQDSNYVQEYILKCVAGEDKYFMVGDVKQSIYRFRLARPDIFLRKYERFADTGRDIKIDLNKNFRSRVEVLDFANTVFEELMRKGTAGLTYDDKARLYYGGLYGENDPKGEGEGTAETIYESEILTLNYDKDEAPYGLDRKDMEIYLVAERIRWLISSGLPIRTKTGTRPIEYRDIVLLFRTAKSYEKKLKQIMTARGIPIYIGESTGYFQTSEIRMIINELEVINNPDQDIPLYGVLTEFPGWFTDEELAMIRSDRTRSLYEELLAYREKNRDDKSFKIEQFLGWLASYRETVPYVGIREIIESLFKEGNFIDRMTAMPGGEQRRANLLLLLEKASDFEKTSYQGLFHFVRYVHQLKAQQIESGGAGILSENANVVRVMTIHKSKGLEFPVCFVCGLNTQFNLADTSGAMLLDMDWGIAVEAIDPKERISQKEIKKQILSDRIKEESIAEELRVLYVALTRAKEKLILTDVRPLTRKEMEEEGLEDLSAGSLEDVEIRAMKDAMTMIKAALKERGRLIRHQRNYSVEYIEKVLAQTSLEAETGREWLESGLYPVSEEIRQQLIKNREGEYGFDEWKGLFTKTTVSELKRAAYEDEEAVEMYKDEEEEYVPSFMKEEAAQKEKSASSRGTAYHKVFERLPFDKLPVENPEEFLRAFLKTEIHYGRLSSEEASMISLKVCLRFLASDVAKRISKAAKEGKLHRETSFFMGVDAKRLNPDFPDTEQIIVQGVIDAYWEEDGELVLLDYKTDRVESEEELKEKYHTQLELYAEALTQITYSTVKEKIIYSLALNRPIHTD